ncbi:MAG TPA: hypothetical protein VKA87_02040 [Nitrososphaeraceae archaeon]|nr:hypothetical protein [Nitrososphaeraceae archaeon]
MLLGLRATAISIEERLLLKVLIASRGRVNSLCGKIEKMMPHHLSEQKNMMSKCASIESPIGASLDAHRCFFLCHECNSPAKKDIRPLDGGIALHPVRKHLMIWVGGKGSFHYSFGISPLSVPFTFFFYSHN